MSATRPIDLCWRRSLAVGGDDAGRFLSAMLERVQAEVGELLRLGMGVDGDHATFVAKFVGSRHCRCRWLFVVGRSQLAYFRSQGFLNAPS